MNENVNKYNLNIKYKKNIGNHKFLKCPDKRDESILKKSRL